MKDAKSSAGGLSGLFSKVGSVTSTVGKGIFNVASKVAAVSVAATTTCLIPLSFKGGGVIRCRYHSGRGGSIGAYNACRKQLCRL